MIEGLKLSHDNDGFNPLDDKFTVLCTTRKTYDTPKETSAWPTCVKSCPKRLPYIPSIAETGLVRVDAPNTIPAGQNGKYVCSDKNLGINRVRIMVHSYTKILSPSILDLETVHSGVLSTKYR